MGPAVGQRNLNVHNLPDHVAESELAGSAVVVIDLLRASSTICQALASGAREIVPFLEVDETLAAAKACDRARIVLGGERRGQRIPGFDLGNSPSEYMPHAVHDRCVYITTTNGTRALHHAKLGRRVLVGALLNLSAVALSIKDEARVDILCAGTNGVPTREDILAAGAFIDRLAGQRKPPFVLNDAAKAARREWDTLIAAAQAVRRSVNDQLAVELRDTPGGRNLVNIGLEQDLVDCGQVDSLNVVPELDVRAWRIRLS
jgi:2-phosphosulfolactate phosphatase